MPPHAHNRQVYVTLAALQACAFLRSWHRYKALPRLLPPSIDGAVLGRHKEVSIVIPCRNEESRVPALLASLDRLTYPPASVLVVDDSSEDRTAALTQAAGHECLRLTHVPPGWTGKNWACMNGARRSEADWLLFIDADVRLAPRCLEVTVDQAEQLHASLYSILLQQKCETFWERLLLPYIYCLYFVTGGGADANSRPGRAIANGQYMLIRRRDYFEVGGHGAVRSSVVDDVALAAAFLRAGKRVCLARGEDLGEVRMYQDLKTLREGFSKNLVEFSARLDGGVVTVVASVLCFWLALTSVRSRSLHLAGLLGFNGALITGWYRAFGVRTAYAILHPLAALAFQVIAAESLVRKLLGTSTWSGRRLS